MAIQKRLRPGVEIPMEVQLAIARDPNAFEAKCAEWDERREAAVQAEAKSTEMARQADVARAKFDAAAGEILTAAKQFAAEKEKDARAESDRLKQVAANLEVIGKAQADRDRVLGTREFAVIAAERNLSAATAKQREIEAQSERWVQALDLRESELRAREAYVAEREAKFANRLKQFSEGL